ncbi:MAG TPA: LacI family DNA-binding transcriptional regulator [Anaerolineae bacterium]|nr:LacI family DNA-binding transcriptional regulator [Anaerolineae bacterium]HQI86331.1 LacI family DNA-binding transcriptional regulator [Anaerolineae bacterium]
MTTIREVAKRAGVAPITVSRVINNSGYVNEKTRARVEAAIADLGYVPNVLARSLRSRRTGTLGLILTDISNPFWTTVARGVEDAASDAGFNVILCNTDESEAEQDKYLHVLMQKQVDGVLLVPARSAVEPIKFIQSQNTSVVVLDRRIPNSQTDVVRCDSEGGAYQLTRLLLSLGHRRIAMLSGPQGVSTAEDRVTGFRRALADAGANVDAAPVYYGKFSLESGYDLTLQALARTPRPSALFAGNNFIAIGALRALRDAGLRVPEDLALVGFDDLPADLVVDPFLTVAAQPAYEMGRQATELLLARLSEEAPAAYQEIVLPTEIVVRGSSGQVLEQ